MNTEENEISNIAVEPKNRGTRGNRCSGLWMKDISITRFQTQKHLQLTDFKVFTLSRPTINLFVFGADQ